MKMWYEKLGENFILGKRFIIQKCDTKHYEKILYLENNFWNENACKTFGANVIENLKNLQKKSNKFSIIDCGTAKEN